MKVLITGTGFIGSHLIEYILQETTWEIFCVDKLSYSTKGWKRLKDSGAYYNSRVLCLTWDLEQPFSEGLITEIGDVNLIIHMAAETHVDRSIADPVGTIRNNVMSTVYLLEYARKLQNLQMFQYFSTDEVFGPAPPNVSFKEWDRHRPTNPYSASKAASEDICIAYQNTYNIPLIVTNLMNVFGPMQHVEKFIPLAIKKIMAGEMINIHTDAEGTPGTRFYIHARHVASAVLFILKQGVSGEKYNIPGSAEISNLELAQKIAQVLGKELQYTLTACHDVRPGHDIRYCLDGTKLAAMGWMPPSDFDVSLRSTVEWTLHHPEWLEP